MGIKDTNNNELVNFSTTASAVNEITVKNAATANAPEISATGTDTNIDLKLTPKGSGNLVFDGIEFPNADGTSGQILQTNGSGVLSFATPAGGGKVLQVVSTTKTDTFTAGISPAGFTDVTGLSVSITPSSASNKILVLATMYGGSSDTTFYGSVGFRILRGAVGLHPANVSSRKGTSGTILQSMTSGVGIGNVNFNYLDSPASTSSLTYKIQVMNTSATIKTAAVNRTGQDSNVANATRTYSTITVMEIAV